jgi:DNA polymerase IIIc chi subunit
MNTETSRVIFFQIKTPLDKVQCLTSTAQNHFSKKERLIIFVENDASLEYVDNLLWKFPAASFLPHSIAETDIQEWIAITKGKKNFNNAHYAFNLCSTPLLIEGFRVIYDFEDTTSPNKKLLSQSRFDTYKQALFAIISERPYN